jgi:hypothetical protein
MNQFQKLVQDELTRACILHPPIHSLHEGFAIILEEVDELKNEVWKKNQERDPKKILSEAVQIAAMVQRTIEDCGIIKAVQ